MKYLPILLAVLLAACGGADKPAEPAASAEAAASPASAPATRQEVINIREIALHPQQSVEQVLGKPVGDCENSKYGPVCKYEHDGDKFEIVYIKGVADWITIESDKFRVFSVPDQLHLIYEKATFQSNEVTRYDGRFGFVSTSVFLKPNEKGGTSVWYVTIKASTE